MNEKVHSQGKIILTSHKANYRKLKRGEIEMSKKMKKKKKNPGRITKGKKSRKRGKNKPK